MIGKEILIIPISTVIIAVIKSVVGDVVPIQNHRNGVKIIHTIIRLIMIHAF